MNDTLSLDAGLTVRTLNVSAKVCGCLAFAEVTSVLVDNKAQITGQVALKLPALNDALTFNAGLTVRTLNVSARICGRLAFTDVTIIVVPHETVLADQVADKVTARRFIAVALGRLTPLGNQEDIIAALLTHAGCVGARTVNGITDAAADLQLGTVIAFTWLSHGVGVTVVLWIIDADLTQWTFGVGRATTLVLDAALFPARFTFCALIITLTACVTITAWILAVVRYLDIASADKPALVDGRAVAAAQLIAAVFAVLETIALQGRVDTLTVFTGEVIAAAFNGLTADLVAPILTIIVAIATTRARDAVLTVTAELTLFTLRRRTISLIGAILAVSDPITDRERVYTAALVARQLIVLAGHRPTLSLILAVGAVLITIAERYAVSVTTLKLAILTRSWLAVTDSVTPLWRVCRTAITEGITEDHLIEICGADRTCTFTVLGHLHPRAAGLACAVIGDTIYTADGLKDRRAGADLTLTALTALTQSAFSVESTFWLRAITIVGDGTSILKLRVDLSADVCADLFIGGTLRPTVDLVGAVGAVFVAITLQGVGDALATGAAVLVLSTPLTVTNSHTAIGRIGGSSVTKRITEHLSHEVVGALWLSDTATFSLNANTRAAGLTGASVALTIAAAYGRVDRWTAQGTADALFFGTPFSIRTIIMPFAAHCTLGTVLRLITAFTNLEVGVVTARGADDLIRVAPAITLVATIGTMSGQVTTLCEGDTVSAQALVFAIGAWTRIAVTLLTPIG